MFWQSFNWVALGVLAVVSLCALAYLVYAGDITIAHARHEARERANLNAAVGLINKTLQSINRDLLYLASEGLLTEAIERPSADADAALIREWLAFSRSKTIYDKIRWIDETGHERLRINYTLSGPRSVPMEQLQDRSLRYFFRDILRLKPLEIYVSPFDLNVEGEVIERPHKPTIRLGTPLFDSSGQRHGVLMLNYYGDDLLSRIIHTLPEIGPHFWLLNAEGYWLHHQNPDEAWGFMFGREDLSLASRYPEAWTRILAERSGQFLNEQGLWTFDTVYPVLEGQKSSMGNARLFSPSQVQSRQYFWKAVTLLPLAEYHAVNAQGVALAHRIGHQLFLLRSTWREASSVLLGLRSRQAREMLAAQVVEHTAQGVMVTDAAVHIEMVNTAFTRITGYSDNETLGRTPFFLQSSEQPTEFYQTLWAHVIKDQSWEGEVWCRRKNGELFAEWLSISALRNAKGAVSHYICLFSDITQLKESEQRMEYFAHHDTLTGLANNRLLHARLQHSIQLAARSGHEFAVLFIDLDRFKQVNDYFGHAAGDELLKEVAQRLSRSLRNEDTLARIGGDEFVVLLENAGTEAEVQRVVDNIREEFPCKVSDAGTTVEVTASIGMSFYPRDGHTVATLLGKADHAMYEAKHRGRRQGAVSGPHGEAEEGG